MPSYNAANTIVEAIESVQRQSYSNWELLIVDDNSNDNTQELVSRYAQKDKRIRFYQLTNNSGGPAIPRNKGLEKSKGEIICFLDADDVWYPAKLEIQISHMIKNEVLFSYSAYDIRKLGSYTTKLYKPDSNTNFEGLLRKNIVGCLTSAVHRSLLKENRFKNIGHEDHEFWLRLTRLNGVQAHCCSSKPLAEYRQAETSRSSNKLKMAFAQWHIFCNELGLRADRALFYYLRFVFNYIWKYK